MSQDPSTPDVSQKTYTKSQPFNLTNLMVENIGTKNLNVCVSYNNNLLI